MASIRVLICEDEGLTTLRLSTALRRWGYEVAGTFGNGSEIIAAAARLRPDLILMDIEMPNLDGISATRQIMSATPTAILIVSAYCDRESISTAMEAGASGYLVKPLTDDQLQPALITALARFLAR